ncbi:hypothetical protein CFP71_10110 [Amycolatopsis thailandensis]|uniref:Uncharacterized protein n=1 Tax=Amycolatopsis thailandensis TaxID=589330 RepID=A0A229SE21_9PSEU|nr:hypothetical protein [Amycolatopsis thailandensis]OXM57080.1 hypothetical protein CFP71_10110 [Amycolatopsis thailandensis]
MANSEEASNFDALAATVKKALDGLGDAKAHINVPVGHASKALGKSERERKERIKSAASDALKDIEKAAGSVMKIVLELKGAASDRRK